MKALSLILTLFLSNISLAKIDWSKAEKEINFIKPAQVSGVPANVIKAIESQGCKVPQSYIEKKPHNLISGSFASQNSNDWAVLCSKNGKSSIFVVWEKESPCPSTFASTGNKSLLQTIDEGKVGYSRYLSSASKEFILKHQKAYGGLLPKNIRHQGIDDAFVEKASVTYYCEGGKWLALQGAD